MAGLRGLRASPALRPDEAQAGRTRRTPRSGRRSSNGRTRIAAKTVPSSAQIVLHFGTPVWRNSVASITVTETTRATKPRPKPRVLADGFRALSQPGRRQAGLGTVSNPSRAKSSSMASASRMPCSRMKAKLTWSTNESDRDPVRSSSSRARRWSSAAPSDVDSRQDVTDQALDGSHAEAPLHQADGLDCPGTIAGAASACQRVGPA